MTFGWKFYVSLAERLLTNPACGDDPELRDSEVQSNYRAALSRAYYGVFGTAYDYLRDTEHDFALNMPILQQQGQVFTAAQIQEVETGTKFIHDYVIRQLSRTTHDQRKDGLRRGLRQVLSSLRERRVEADYRQGLHYDRRTIRVSIDDAKTALNYLQQLCR